jgi:hypothetical protein
LPFEVILEKAQQQILDCSGDPATLKQGGNPRTKFESLKNEKR